MPRRIIGTMIAILDVEVKRAGSTITTNRIVSNFVYSLIEIDLDYKLIIF
jgi:hypothetical protein